MNKPLVSVIVPVYNAGKDIETLIKCMKAQTYSRWEMIIVDDQSTDYTISIINSFSSTDNRIKLEVRGREPKGSATCRNIGLELAEGTYFINIDSDDLVSNDFIEDRVNFMEHNLDCDYATFRACSVNIKEDKLYPTGKIWGKDESEDILLDFLKTKYPFSIWNNIYRRELFKNEKWDESVKIYTDFSYAVPIILKGYNHKFSQKEECDYFYRMGVQNSMTANFISKEKYESTKYLFSKTWDEISVLSNSSKYKKAFTKFFILQYTRLLYNGTENQQKDYINYCQEYLDKFVLRKMKVIFIINKLSSSISSNRHMISKLIIGLFYYPNNIVSALSNKIGLNNK